MPRLARWAMVLRRCAGRGTGAERRDVGAVLESPPGLREIVARLAECQVKVVSTDPAALVPAELAVLSV